MIVPKTSAIARPSATAVSVALVAFRNAGSVMTCGIAITTVLGFAT